MHYISGSGGNRGLGKREIYNFPRATNRKLCFAVLFVLFSSLLLTNHYNCTTELSCKSSSSSPIFQSRDQLFLHHTAYLSVCMRGCLCLCSCDVCKVPAPTPPSQIIDETIDFPAPSVPPWHADSCQTGVPRALGNRIQTLLRSGDAGNAATTLCSSRQLFSYPERVVGSCLESFGIGWSWSCPVSFEFVRNRLESETFGVSPSRPSKQWPV